MGLLKQFWDWTKGGMQMPKVAEAVEKTPVLKEVLAYEPKGGVEAGLAATGIGLISTLGIVAAAKVIGTGIVKAIPKLIPKTIKGKIIAGTTTILGIGILKESPIAREAAVTGIRDIQEKPAEIFGFGEDIGKFIEGTGEKPGVVEGLKKAGIVGGLAALGIGGAIVAPKIIEKVKGWGADEQIM